MNLLAEYDATLLIGGREFTVCVEVMGQWVPAEYENDGPGGRVMQYPAHVEIEDVRFKHGLEDELAELLAEDEE